jgi:hypothetical protein
MSPARVRKKKEQFKIMVLQHADALLVHRHPPGKQLGESVSGKYLKNHTTN